MTADDASDAQQQHPIAAAWGIHHRITMMMVEALPEAGLSATLSTRGGRDVARQLAHIQAVRASRLKAFAKKVGAPPPTEFDPKASPPKEELVAALRASGELMGRYMHHCATENDGAVPNFKRGVEAMLGYYISHEAHHRGHAILTMKQAGVTLPDQLRMGIWDWNKL